MKIFLAGHKGLVGSAILRNLREKSGRCEDIEILTKTRQELDLTNQSQVQSFLKKSQPDIVINAAAKVGGILANNSFPADFIYENLMIEANLIHNSFEAGVKRFLNLGSSCIYPKEAAQPIRETSLLTGPLEPTNEPYAIAKIAGIKLCESYNRQYDVDYRSVMPTNLYGPGDNFHPKNSHVLPALMRRIHEAKIEDAPNVVIWGSGKPKREFLHVADLASACLFVLDLEKEKYDEITDPMMSHINIGSGIDVSISELAEKIAKIIGFRGEIQTDLSKPDGTPRKLMDISRLNALGWSAKIDLDTGIKDTYQWFLQNEGWYRA